MADPARDTVSTTITRQAAAESRRVKADLAADAPKVPTSPKCWPGRPSRGVPPRRAG
jgi:hypothetical protein